MVLKSGARQPSSLQRRQLSSDIESSGTSHAPSCSKRRQTPVLSLTTTEMVPTWVAWARPPVATWTYLLLTGVRVSARKAERCGVQVMDAPESTSNPSKSTADTGWFTKHTRSFCTSTTSFSPMHTHKSVAGASGDPAEPCLGSMLGYASALPGRRHSS